MSTIANCVTVSQVLRTEMLNDELSQLEGFTKKLITAVGWTLKLHAPSFKHSKEHERLLTLLFEYDDRFSKDGGFTND